MLFKFYIGCNYSIRQAKENNWSSPTSHKGYVVAEDKAEAIRKIKSEFEFISERMTIGVSQTDFIIDDS